MDRQLAGASLHNQGQLPVSDRSNLHVIGIDIGKDAFSSRRI